MNFGEQRTSPWVRTQVAVAPPLRPEQTHQLSRSVGDGINATGPPGAITTATLDALGGTP